MIFEILCGLVLPLLIYFVYCYINQILSMKNYPAGPFPLPIIGNLHQIGKKPYLKFTEMAKTYGNVFSVSMGVERVVIVNTIEPAKEALIKRSNDFAGRPKNYPMELLSRGYKTIGFADYGPYYITMRKIGHAALKGFGENTKNLEKIVVDESKHLHLRLRDLEGKPINVTYEFGLSIVNTICDLVFGSRYNPEEKDFKEVIDFTTLIFQGLACSDFVALFPWMRYLPLEGISKLKKGLKIRDRILHERLQEHKATFDPENIRDCTDSILKVLTEEKTLQNSQVGEFNDDHIEMVINDIFVGGTETTNNTLRWAVLYLIHWPEYQDQIYEEIKEKIGINRYPTMADRSILPLTHAFIKETHRYSSIAPLGVPRKSTVNTELNGVKIKKDTQVLFNLWHIHHDPRYWDEPEKFNPRRFLDENGEYIVGARESYIPFSAGRRACLGEAFAKIEMFLFLSRLLRDYNIMKVPGEQLPPLEGDLGITLSAKPFNVIFKSRNNNLTGS